MPLVCTQRGVFEQDVVTQESGWHPGASLALMNMKLDRLAREAKLVARERRPSYDRKKQPFQYWYERLQDAKQDEREAQRSR